MRAATRCPAMNSSATVMLDASEVSLIIPMRELDSAGTAVPALSNSLIGMIKDTSLASNITVAELFMAGQRVAARTYIFLPIYCEVAVVYLLFCTVITKLQALLERRLNAHGFQ